VFAASIRDAVSHTVSFCCLKLHGLRAQHLQLLHAPTGDVVYQTWAAVVVLILGSGRDCQQNAAAVLLRVQLLGCVGQTWTECRMWGASSLASSLCEWLSQPRGRQAGRLVLQSTVTALGHIWRGCVWCIATIATALSTFLARLLCVHKLYT
jgi:hypothetical protein